MYCVIQEIERKKEDKNGYPKKLKCYPSTFTIFGETKTTYFHCFSDERFDRPIKKAYRIYIHNSYRENGKVKKQQACIGTVGYYELAADNFFNTYDWFDSKITSAANQFKCESCVIYDLIDEKLNPLKEQIQAEFSLTDEYMVHCEHERITTLYAANKAQFNDKYNNGSPDGSRYDEIYDVFGNVMNPDLLKKIQQEYQDNQEYERKSEEYQRSYYENFYNNYNSGSSSYDISNNNNYTENDKAMLKQFYKVLSKKFHPDANPGIDTSDQMKLLNQLKQGWGI